MWWALPFVESLKILKSIYRIDDKIYDENLSFFKNLIDLKELLGKTVRQMSLGQRTLCDILAAFLHDPNIVFLDEPTIGIDIFTKKKIRDVIKAINLKKKTTIILTTHDISDVEALCNRVVVIDKGEKIFDNTMDYLKENYGNFKILRFKYQGEKTAINEQEDLKFTKEILGSITPEIGKSNVFFKDNFFSVVVKKEKMLAFEIAKKINEYKKIEDLTLQDAKTEEIIKNIYSNKIEALI